MAKITTITNPLTGQPAQVDQLEHTAQQIDDAIARAISGGAIDIALQKKVDLGEDGKVPAEQVDAYSRSDSISAGTRTALSLPETATPDAALAEIARQLSEGGGYIESTDYPGCYYRTVGGVTEWVNPPMILNKEYRTTERYNGKPVYKRAVNIGDITGDGTLTFAANGATTVLSGELLYNGYLPFNFIHERNLSSSWTRYANVTKQGSKIEVSYYIGSSYGTSENTVVILRYLKD